MSSYNKAQKAAQRVHKERSQLASRTKLGLLEKKKDYQLRAKDFGAKKAKIKKLKQKALEKNPDEFYFRMISSKFEDGVTKRLEEDEPLTWEQKQLMDSQDIRYVSHKRHLENKKIDKMKGSLHLLDASTANPMNKHTFFVDTAKEERDFDVAKRLNTHPSLLHRTFNRPKLEDLKKGKFSRQEGDMEKEFQAQMLEKSKQEQYDQLVQRIKREKQLGIIGAKMQAKINLKDRGKKVLLQEETQTTPAVYKWLYKRKR
ncbi:putative U3 small nucleolar RNA-associated protein 11 [Apostichopus japonicus]|uniref:U3 small nucleolar RNA-associated protein 11 n=1 Tax=Stichopus japonicus TaxID=307972 RepID=A0A2G8K849_STIJA|nr:putative U3 small nucleolar RNA-associated protein 11 [Apostichopus japonicus]